eukprot:2916421-Prymnesium_polylepis.1
MCIRDSGAQDDEADRAMRIMNQVLRTRGAATTSDGIYEVEKDADDEPDPEVQRASCSQPETRVVLQARGCTRRLRIRRTRSRDRAKGGGLARRARVDRGGGDARGADRQELARDPPSRRGGVPRGGGGAARDRVAALAAAARPRGPEPDGLP